MEKRHCKRCNATKDIKEFNEINLYCMRCLEKERAKYQRLKEQKKEYFQREAYCEVCDCTIRRCRLSLHLKTLKHIKNKIEKDCELNEEEESKLKEEDEKRRRKEEEREMKEEEEERKMKEDEEKKKLEEAEEQIMIEKLKNIFQHVKIGGMV